MLDLAISLDSDAKGVTVVETNQGVELKAPGWPQDSDARLVAFGPKSKTCEVLWPEHLASDIGHALKRLQEAGCLKGRKPDWYRRLALVADGSSLV
jgi:hypothetical protein